MSDPLQPWRQLVLDLARALRVDVVALWLARQRWVIWLDAHLPALPPWWRVWAWCALVYAAVVLGLLAWTFLTEGFS
jgi:hypothetical protein